MPYGARVLSCVGGGYATSRPFRAAYSVIVEAYGYANKREKRRNAAD